MITTRWIASLSDGQTAIEGKGDYQNVDNQLSPWQKLIRYIYSNNLTINGLRISLEKDGESIKTFHLPTKSPKGRFNHLSSQIPERFNYFRRYSEDMTAEQVESGEINVNLNTGAGESFIEVHAIYETYILYILVNENTGNDAYFQIVPKEEYKQ